MIAKELIQKDLISLKPNHSAGQALEILIENKISGAPVIDDHGTLVGIVTEKDLLVSFDFLGTNHAKDVMINEFMTTEVIGMPSNSTVKEVAAEIVRKNVKRIPLMENDKIIGVVSRRDVLLALHNKIKKRHIGSTSNDQDIRENRNE